jgi:hypothetical protein
MLTAWAASAFTGGIEVAVVGWAVGHNSAATAIGLLQCCSMTMENTQASQLSRPVLKKLDLCSMRLIWATLGIP